MVKTFIFLGLLTFLVSCNDQSCPVTIDKEEATASCPAPSDPNETTEPHEPDEPTEPTEPSDPTEPGEDVGDIPQGAYNFEFNVSLFKFDSKDEEKLYRAFDIIKQVVRTKEFKEKVLNHKYQGINQFVDNKGLTNEQIYQSLIDGSEALTPGIDHEVDMELELYYKNNNTIGYTYASKTRVWMNTKFFDQYTPRQVARNVFHEWTHKLGYKHDSKATTRRKYSVPYGVGKIIEELGKQYE